MFKVCTSCNVSLNVSCFLTKSQTGLLLPSCKECTNRLARSVRLAIKNKTKPSTLTQEFKSKRFIEKALAMHCGDYSYERVKYVSSKERVEIFCTKHNDYFLQTPNVHLKTSGCPVCGHKDGGLKAKVTAKEFLENSKIAHGERYDYSLMTFVGREVPVDIRCKEHNYVFSQIPSVHMTGSTGCKLCYKSAREASADKIASERCAEGFWFCNTCKQELTTDSFLLRGNGSKRLYSVCKLCRAKRSMAENEIIRKCPILARKRKEYSADYTRKNSAAANVKSTKRRVRKLECTPDWLDVEYESLFMIEIHSLSIMRKLSTGFGWHVDHMVPLTSNKVCGLHCSDNLQLIPAFDNLSKGNAYWPNMP